MNRREKQLILWFQSFRIPVHGQGRHRAVYGSANIINKRMLEIDDVLI